MKISIGVYRVKPFQLSVSSLTTVFLPFFFLSFLFAQAQTDTLRLSTKGGKIQAVDSLNIKPDTLRISSKGGKTLRPDTLTKTEIVLTDTLEKKFEFPPTTDAVQRWEKKAYRRFLKELPKPIGTLLTPLDSSHQDPNVAYQRSMLIPGWGQAYNRSYWKIPVIYAGLGTLGYWMAWNNQKYLLYQRAYRFAVDSDSSTKPTSVPGVKPQQAVEGYRSERDQYRRTRDQAVIFIAGVYAVQIVEAYINAHLKYFDVGEDLSLQIAPTLVPSTAYKPPQAGIGINFRF